MTRVYFVRHAQPDNTVRDDRNRPLTDEGKNDTRAVADLLKSRNVGFIASSPYERAIETVGLYSLWTGLDVNIYEDLRERNAGSWQGDNFFEYIEKQWADFDYHIKDGESLREVQTRNIRALRRILSEHEGDIITIATHGTALSTILNHYYPEFDFKCFKKIVDFMPFIIRLDFDGEKCVNSQVELVIHKDYRPK
ncbi:MAG: histidine phosphatase family protein [Oscillospiraceae bacterium]|nr:histidine phosphatase family protein [Oscillospiraceae bacterium]